MTIYIYFMAAATILGTLFNVQESGKVGPSAIALAMSAPVYLRALGHI